MGYDSDIEDLEVDISIRQPANANIININRKSSLASQNNSDCTVSQQPYLPGAQKVWLKTFGCSHNVSDSEYMEGLLTEYGYSIVPESERADIWVINSCTVKDPSQAAFVNLVQKAKQDNLPVLVAGCVPQADRTLSGMKEVSMIGVSQIDRVVEAVEQTLQGNTVRMMAKKELPRLDLPKVRKNPLVEIIPLSTGCLGSCTYCKTRHARGKLGSYALEAIVDRVRYVCTEGVSEIWLSSEDTGAYGRDIGTNIGELLKAIIAALPERGVMLRVGMTNPPYILEHLSVIAEILRHPKVFSFLHIPVQAGSDRVLTAMNREYTVAEFRKVADYLLANVPDVTIATDIICGFPNETEADFEETMLLMAHYKLPVVNISQFYPRPGTPAAKMRRLPTQIVKERSRRLTKLFERFQPHSHLLGQVIPVWFDIEVSEFTRVAEEEEGDGEGGGRVGQQHGDGAEESGPKLGAKVSKKQSVGHSKAYTKVLVPYDDSLPGTCQLVRVQRCQRFHVEGEVVQMVHPRHMGSNSVVKARSSRPATLPVAKYPAASGRGSSEGEGCNDCGGRSSSGCCEGSGGVACGCADGETAAGTPTEAVRVSSLSLALFATAAMLFIVFIRQR